MPLGLDQSCAAASWISCLSVIDVMDVMDLARSAVIRHAGLIELDQNLFVNVFQRL
jgi:hypothetical protein